MVADCKTYLIFSKTCLTFVIFFIKILKAKNIEQHFSMSNWSNLPPLRGKQAYCDNFLRIVES